MILKTKILLYHHPNNSLPVLSRIVPRNQLSQYLTPFFTPFWEKFTKTVSYGMPTSNNEHTLQMSGPDDKDNKESYNKIKDVKNQLKILYLSHFRLLHKRSRWQNMVKL